MRRSPNKDSFFCGLEEPILYCKDRTAVVKYLTKKWKNKMIIFLIVIVLLVLSIVGAVLIDCDFHEYLFQVLSFAIVFLAVVAIVMCTIIMFANINYKGYILSMNALIQSQKLVKP